jgi:ketosteroid isomerase-like protein
MLRFRIRKFAPPLFSLLLLLLLSNATYAGNAKGHFQGVRQPILDLIYAYSTTYDRNDMPGWLNLFTEDAVWAWYAGPDYQLTLQLNGVQEMETFFAPRRADLEAQGIQPRHYQTNTVFLEMSGNTAKTRTYILITWKYDSAPAAQIQFTGYYEDTFVKTPDGWKFKERVLFSD